MLLCFGLRLTKFPGKGFQWLVSHGKGFRARLKLECISYRKAGLIRCYHHPHPPQAVPPLPEGEGSLRWRITSLVEGEGSLRTIIPHTQGERNFWEDGFCDFAFGSAQNDRDGRHTAQSESLRIGETRNKGVWCYAHWLLMQNTLVVDALCIDVAFIGCWNCVRWLLRFCTLAVDTLSIDVDDERIDVNVAFNGCWHSVHWTLSLSALLINTECFAWWCSAHWMLLLSALMLMLSALMLILHSLDADALCIAWRCSVHWLLILCALILLSAYWCWCCLK